MADRSMLTSLAKKVAADMASGRSSTETQMAMRLLEEAPEHAFDLVDLIAEEGARKRPKDKLIGAYALLLAHVLELLRYAVERGEAEVLALVQRLRDHVLDRGNSGRISPPMLLLVLNQFAAAKLDMGDALRELMQSLMEDAAETEGELGDEVDDLAFVARSLDGDPFAIHGLLDQTAEATPEEARARLAVAVFTQNEPAVREAILGFLLNGSRLVRTSLAGHIELAAPRGAVSPTALRRMIAMRNWLPTADQPALDKAIKACRTSGIDCAPWPKPPKALRVLATGMDGSGAHTVLTVAKEAGKQVVAALLVKLGTGVRDAWVRRGATKAEVREILDEVGNEVGLAPSSLDYLAMVTRHFLAINGQSGVMPPFGLLDFAETVGLTDLNPDPLPTEKLITTLCDAIDPARLSEAAVVKTLRDSAGWADEHPTLASWFEDDVGKILGTKRAPHAKLIATLLAGPLQSRRRRWAEIAAWTCLCLKHQPDNEDWQGFAILARELLGQRPLDEIGIMHTIADTTLTVRSMQRLLGAAHAA